MSFDFVGLIGKVVSAPSNVSHVGVVLAGYVILRLVL